MKKRKPAFSAEVFGALVHTITKVEHDRLRESMPEVHVVLPERRGGSDE